MKLFRRKIYSEIKKWKEKSNGKTALLINGARRIGKSTIAQEFAKNEYKSFIMIDFAEASDRTKALFDDISDLNFIFIQLQMIYQTQLHTRQSVIIFDEVQLLPKARQAIKYLVKDGRYDYIETGSLLSIKKNIKDIVIPSEETRINMYPMDYEEFRWALDDNITIPLLRDAFKNRHSLGDAVSRKLMRDFRLYMLVGGMPQAVNTYLDTNNLADVDAKKREIIDLYIDDFLKIDPSGKISKLFSAIPAQLSKNASRYQRTSVLGRHETQDTVDEFLRDMEDSLTVNFAHHADNPSVGLPAHTDYNQYKMYMGDTGLFITLAFWDKEVTENIIYQKLLSDKLSADLGYVYENVVAQMLVASGNKLFYHTWPSTTSNHNYEIDFILSRGAKLTPLEVKSSGYNTHISLDIFCKKFSEHVGSRCLLYTKDLRKDEDITLLPVFMTMFL